MIVLGAITLLVTLCAVLYLQELWMDNMVPLPLVLAVACLGSLAFGLLVAL